VNADASTFNTIDDVEHLLHPTFRKPWFQVMIQKAILATNHLGGANLK